MIDVDGGNTVYYYHFDGLGSVAALSDVNNVTVERYSYDVFGAPTIYDVNSSEISQSAIGNPYMFTARRADNETALYYYRARYYAFDIGRFLQIDPIGYIGGLNLYTYCGNNPVRWVDPQGLFLVRIGGAAGLGGRITFGKNYGRWHIGISIGYGLGGEIKFIPSNIEPSFASKGLAGNVELEASGSLRVWTGSVGGGIRGRTEHDWYGNMETRVGLIGGVSGPKGTINMTGSLDTLYQMSGDRNYIYLDFDKTRNPVEYGLGGMGFAGVTGGVTWGKINRGSNIPPWIYIPPEDPDNVDPYNYCK